MKIPLSPVEWGIFRVRSLPADSIRRFLSAVTCGAVSGFVY